MTTPDEPGAPKSNPAIWTDEERWQILMNNVKDYGIFMLDPRGTIVTWNVGAERILGYKEEEILGHNFCEIFTPHDIGKEQPQFELMEAREKGRAEDERWHLRKDGSRLWASGVVTPLWDPNGTLRGFAKVLRDITERKRNEDRMAEENQRKDEFLAMLSHELRNPLAAISNAVQLLKLDPAESTPQTGVIERQVSSLVQLVNDLTDISRMRSGKIQLRIERGPLNEIVSRAVEAVQHIMEDRQHKLVVSVPSEAIWVDADANRLQQVFCNLLNNAAKYTDPGGHIELTVERVGNEAFIRIRDNGTGIVADMLARIFDLFIQADHSLDRSQGGLGIGLTLAKRLVEMHGGTVEARSEGVGRGSEFTVRLPVVPELAAIDRPITSEVVPANQGMRLLLAEDKQDTAKTMATLLRKLGHEVAVVRDGSAALRAIQIFRPDVLLLDIGLPVINGYQVAERVRQQPELEHILLIALTGYGRQEDCERARAAGFDHHLVKPVDLVKLQELLPTG
jgi:PAS domain S-box-containing protein